MGSHKKSMKYSGLRKLLCDVSKFSKFNAFILLPCIITFVQSNYVYCIMSCNACSTLKFEVNVLGLQTYTNTHSLIKNWVVLRCPTCLMLEWELVNIVLLLESYTKCSLHYNFLKKDLTHVKSKIFLFQFNFILRSKIQCLST